MNKSVTIDKGQRKSESGKILIKWSYTLREDDKTITYHQIYYCIDKSLSVLGEDENEKWIEVNKEEAKHSSLFVSGWRPAVGWTCTLALLSNFILIPMTNFILVLADSDITIPLIDVSTMMPVLMGMLGLGTMRTVEKINKVERNT